MKSVLISIRPKWVKKIIKGEKTIEVRKSKPKLEAPFKCYIYKTKKRILRDITHKGDIDWFGNIAKETGICSCPDWDGGKVIGEFICDKVYNLVNAFGGIVFADENLNQLESQLFMDMSCLTDEQTEDYLGNKDGYGLHITDLKIYDKPKELSEFFTPMGKRPSYMIERPPQSWQYVEELENGQNSALFI